MYFQERSFASQQLPLDLSPERLYNASGFWSKLRHIGTLDRQSAKFVPNSDTQLAELDLNHEVLSVLGRSRRICVGLVLVPGE